MIRWVEEDDDDDDDYIKWWRYYFTSISHYNTYTDAGGISSGGAFIMLLKACFSNSKLAPSIWSRSKSGKNNIVVYEFYYTPYHHYI